MSAHLAPVFKQKFTDSNGYPLSGGKLYSYEAGTSTPLATYNSRAGNVANDNPVILDSNGEADIWLGPGAYKIILHDANDVLQYSVDGIIRLDEGEVTTYALADLSVTTAKLGALAVTAAKLAADAVETDKIKDGAVTEPKIGALAVTAAKLASNAVETTKIADGAVTGAKAADNTFPPQKLLLNKIASSASGSAQIFSPQSYTNVTNLSVSITTTGRTVKLYLIQDGTNTPWVGAGIIGGTPGADGTATGTFRFRRGSTTIGYAILSIQGILDSGGNIGCQDTPATISLEDTPAAGTYTYTLQYQAPSPPSGQLVVNCQNVKLVAKEE